MVSRRVGLVEGSRYVGTPVDDDRVTVLVADVSPADVQRLVGRVDAPEEERRIRVVDKGRRAVVQGRRKVCVGDRVAADCLERERAFAHPHQRCSGRVEVGALPCQLGGKFADRHERTPFVACSARPSE